MAAKKLDIYGKHNAMIHVGQYIAIQGLRTQKNEVHAHVNVQYVA